jgi:predicted DCC family thiol-disulfide oxidoreductase YuxK
VDEPLPPRLVLYDGTCGLCHRTVRWLVRHDRARALRYAPLQGDAAARARAAHPELPADLDNVVFLDDGRVHVRSAAFLAIARHLPAPWRWARALEIVPRPILDLAYRFVARVRYRVFGRRPDACELPTPDERARFLS